MKGKWLTGVLVLAMAAVTLGAFGEKGHPAWRYRIRGTGEASEKQEKK